MTDWTPERLDALPEGTVIDAIMTVYDSIDPFRLIRDGAGWRYVDDGEYITTEALHEDADSIRVVSVPIDVRRALERLRERLLDMAATRMPPLFRDQLLELAEVAKTALEEVEE